MKTINRMQSELGATKIKELHFTHAATNTRMRRKGYAFYWPLLGSNTDAITEELILEPCDNLGDNDKWLIYGPLIRRYICGVLYAKNLPDARKKILKIMKG